MAVGRWWYAAIVILVVGTAWLGIRHTSHLVDELPHHNQIQLFLQCQTATDPLISTLPGFHVIIAAVAKVTGYGYDNLNVLRLYVACFSLMSILLFFGCVKELGAESPFVKVTQYVFLPILFPYFVLLYTDVMSLLFVLMTLFFILRRSYIPGVTAGVVSIFVRQNNIVWLGFFFLFFLDQEYGTWFRHKLNPMEPAERKPGNRVVISGLLFVGAFAT